MVARFRSWRQRIKQHPIATALISLSVLLFVVALVGGYKFNWDWTGFNGYTQASTIRTIGGPAAGTVTRTETNQPGKTLWDWLGIAAIPLAVALGTAWFTKRQNQTQLHIAELHQ